MAWVPLKLEPMTNTTPDLTIPGILQSVDNGILQSVDNGVVTVD